MTIRAGIIADNELNSDIRVLREIRILKNDGIDVHVLCFSFGKNLPVPVEGISVTRITLSRKLKDTMFFFLNRLPVYECFWARKIRKHILENDLDILHVHDLYMAKAAHRGIRKSRRKIPLVLDLHENYPYSVSTYNWTKGPVRHLLSKPGAWLKKEAEYLSYADRIVVLSEEYAESLMSKYRSIKREAFVIFPNVPDQQMPEYTDKFVATNPFRNDYPILLYYGVIAERRGIFDTLSVFAQLVSEGYGVNLLLIGPVDKKDQPRFSSMLDSIPEENICHVPWIDAKQFPGYLEISDICLAPFHKNPQHESGVANKIYDYMLGGKPVIASDCKPQKDLLEKYTCGLVFNDMDGFRENIIKLIGDKSLRIQLGGNGKQAILKDLNMEKVQSRLTGMYHSLFPSE